MAKARYFIAGTDTEVGKTLVSCALLHAANQQGMATLGLKPIAAGCEETPEGLRNEDAVALSEAATIKLSYEQINAVALKSAIAPHIAADQENRRLQVDRIVGICRGAMMTPHDFCVVEGAGGWRVPLSPAASMSNLAQALDLPVILVVGIRLGCLNHALLTAEAIRNDRLRLAGWVANVVSPEMAEIDANIATLDTLLPCPRLGKIPFEPQINSEIAAEYLDINKLQEVSRP